MQVVSPTSGFKLTYFWQSRAQNNGHVIRDLEEIVIKMNSGRGAVQNVQLEVFYLRFRARRVDKQTVISAAATQVHKSTHT